MTAFIPGKRVRSSQPSTLVGINYSLPITRDLLIATLYSDGKLVNAVNNSSAIEAASSGGGTNPVIQVEDSRGRGFSYDGLWHKFSNQGFNPYNSFTISCVAYLPTITKPFSSLFNIGSANDSFLAQALYGGTILYFGSSGTGATDITPEWNGLHNLTVVHDSATGDISVYYDGVLMVTLTGITWNKESTNVDFVLGDDPEWNGNDGWPGVIYSTQVFQRALSSTEVQGLSDNPWQVFEPANQAVYFLGTASTDLSGAATATGSATGTITGQLELAGGSVSVATAAGGLTSALNLSGAAISVAVGAGELLMTQDLSVASQAQASASGVLADGLDLSVLAQAQVLAGGDIKMTLSLDGASVAQAIASAALSTDLDSSAIYDARFDVVAKLRDFTIIGRARDFEIIA